MGRKRNLHYIDTSFPNSSIILDDDHDSKRSNGRSSKTENTDLQQKKGNFENGISQAYPLEKARLKTFKTMPSEKKKGNPRKLGISVTNQDQDPENDSCQSNTSQATRLKDDAIEKIQAFRKTLPIYQARGRILEEIEANPCVIIMGETGSGKTTQVVQFIYEHFGCDTHIAITEPRRLAAKTTAIRVAQEMNVQVGDLVGYHIRFDRCTSNNTKITFMTDGMAVRECMIDPKIMKYQFVILDEVHERNLDTDILCALVRQIQQQRPTLKIIVMSATLEAELFERYFKAKVLYIQGRQYPVRVMYLAKNEHNWIDAMVATVMQLHVEEPLKNKAKDMLAFLTGREEIEIVAQILHERAKKLPPGIAKMIVCPLYSTQSEEQQRKVFEKTSPNCRKVVLATNIAETSITVPDITYVIDSGLVKLKQRMIHTAITGQDEATTKKEEREGKVELNTILEKEMDNLNSRLEMTREKQVSTNALKKMDSPHVDLLAVVVESKAQAWQRAGRAGRTGPGKAFRLFTEAYFLNNMPETQAPEIKRVDLTSLLLQLFTIGITDPLHFPYLDPPNKKALSYALFTLLQHGAISREKSITQLGKEMAMFPLDPAYAKVLISSRKFGSTCYVMSIIAMLNIDNVFVMTTGDHSSSNCGEYWMAEQGQPLGEVVSNQPQLNVIKPYGSVTAAGMENMDRARAFFSSKMGDHFLLLNVYQHYLQEPVGRRKEWAKRHSINWRGIENAIKIKEQLIEYWRANHWPLETEKTHKSGEESDWLTFTDTKHWEEMTQCIAKCFLMGFFQNVAVKTTNGGTYETLKEQKGLTIHPSSCLFKINPECIVFTQLMYTSKFYMREIIAIQRQWMEELFHEYVINIKSN